MKLNKIEKETVITFNEGEESALVYTYNRALQHKLDRLYTAGGAIVIATERTGSKTYRVPKTWVRISQKKKINYSADQRKMIAERLSNKQRNVKSNL